MISEYYLNYYRSIVFNIIAEKKTSCNIPGGMFSLCSCHQAFVSRHGILTTSIKRSIIQFLLKNEACGGVNLPSVFGHLGGRELIVKPTVNGRFFIL